jgi:excisionase family DNA binding protein
MDDVLIKGIKYISSKQAAQLTGYAKDYIGQLVRMNKLKAVKVGRAWFVDEKEVMAMAHKAVPTAQAGLTASVVERKVETVYKSTVTASVSFPRSWSEIKYLNDDSPLLPNSDSRDMATYNASFNNSLLGDAEQYRINLSKKATATLDRSAHVAHGISDSRDYVSVDGVRVSVRTVPAEQSVEPFDTQYHEEPAERQEKPLLLGTQVQKVNPSFFENAVRVVVSACAVALVVFFVPLIG